MKIWRGYNENELLRIAKAADNKQVLADVRYASFVRYHNPQSIYCERTDNAFILGQFQKGAFRIIGMATTVECRGKGIGTLLLSRAIACARERGLKIIHTHSKSGAEFYVKRGFDIVGKRGEDYLLKKEI